MYKILCKFIQVVTGIELPCETEVGKEFVIDHFGGVAVSGHAKFGNNCRIRNGVVVGLKNVEESGAPIIGNNVDIGAGAKVLGKIGIGNNVLIGANAVVITDVPANSIAVGIPAVIEARSQDQVSEV
jgi:serine O-acetyltransferase